MKTKKTKGAVHSMRVTEFRDKFQMQVLAGEPSLNNDINGVYSCDLLSWVMCKAQKGNVWITVLTNINIVAVAVLTEVACIIIPDGIKVEESTLKKAEDEGVVILGTDMPIYEIYKKSIELGV